MNEILSLRPLLAVGAGIAAALPILLCGKRPNLRESWTFLAAALQLGAALSMLPAAIGGAAHLSPALPLLPGAALQFRADPLALVFLILSSILWTATSAYSVGYLRTVRLSHQTGYFASFAVAAAAAAGIALAANLVTFLICYEVLTLATWPLVVHRRTPAVLGSGRSYLAYTLLAGQLLLGAVVWAGILAPGADFTPGGFLAGTAGDGALRVLFVLFLIGVGAKAAVFPLHGWLPAAMVAPTPVSALLHGGRGGEGGRFRDAPVDRLGLRTRVDGGSGAQPAARPARGRHHPLRFPPRVGRGPPETPAGLLDRQPTQLHRARGALGTPLALAGAAFHIAAHGFMKITLFFCAGSVYAATGKERIPDLAGLGRAMPITFGAFAVGALGMAGIPLLPGFLGKWNIALGGIGAGQTWVAALLVTSGLLNLAYYLPILRIAFFEGGHPRGVSEPSSWLVAPPALAALAAIILGVAPNAGVRFWFLAEQAAQSVLRGAPDLLARFGGAP